MGLIRLGGERWLFFFQRERDLLHSTRRAKAARQQLLQAQSAKGAGHRSTLEPLQYLTYDRVYLSPLLPVVAQASSMHSGGSTVKGDIGEAQKWLMYVKV